MENKYFLCTYTAESKDYCEDQVFSRLAQVSKDDQVEGLWVMDNSATQHYSDKLSRKLKNKKNTKIEVIWDNQEPAEPRRTKFLRKVATSVNKLRDVFLNTNADYFLIVESDVLVPEDLITQLDAGFEYLRTQSLDKPVGAQGGIYYIGFHDYTLRGIQPAHHVLSGCTAYSRAAVEKYPFRWSDENLGAFPDAWFCYDAGKDFGLYNNHNIHCKHLAAPNGTRYSKPI